MINKKILILIIILIINLNFKSYSIEGVFVKYKINDEIITNIDVENESSYLIALNNELTKLSDTKILEIAKNSIIKETVKKIELLKYFTLDQNNPFLDKVIKDFYLKLQLNNEDEFEKYLSNYNLTIQDIKKKIEIETVWNQLIYEKFKNQVTINNDALKKRINQNIISETNTKYQLSEIIFDKRKDEPLNKTIKKIHQSIMDIGFKNTANIYSVGDSAKFGGDIGWVDEDNLSNKTVNIIKKLKIGEFSKKIHIGNSYLILKVDNIKKEKKKIDKKKEFSKMVLFEQNKQLEKFSKIYYNKIKINTSISEL
jgi:peptidyl-prolyl cis-trans isomerase SurA